MNLPLDLDTFDLVLECILLDGAECGAVMERLWTMKATEGRDTPETLNNGHASTDHAFPLPRLSQSVQGPRRTGGQESPLPEVRQAAAAPAQT